MTQSTGYLVGRLWRDWVRGHLGRIAGAAALMVVIAATSAAYPMLIELAIDMLGNADRRVLTLLPAAIIAITVTRGLAGRGQADDRKSDPHREPTHQRNVFGFEGIH